MAVYEVGTDFIQKIGNDLYKINFSTLARLVAIKSEAGADSTLQKEIEAIRTAISSLNSTLSGEAKVYVKDDITGRDGISTKNTGDICYVKDASSDSTVNSGAASYIWDGTKWDKLSEFESMDIVLNWSDIQNRPTSTSGGITIETSLDMAHTHTNKDTIDKFGESDGKLTYNGQKVGFDYGAVFTAKVTGDNPDYNTAITALGDIPNNSAIIVMREEATAYVPPTTGLSTTQPLSNKSFSLRLGG